MDAFDFALGVVLSQFKENDILHIVDFCFYKKNLVKWTMKFMTKKI